MDVTLELPCRLAVVNRQRGVIEDFSSGSITTRKINKKSTLSKESFIIVGASPNHTGIKYNLNGNIEHLSTEFLNQGHVTVSLKEPSCTIYLTNADLKKLAEFISYFKQLLPAHLVMAASEPPNSRINLNLRFQETYYLRMENIIDMKTNLDHFTQLEICDCTLELAGDQVPFADAIRKMKNLTTLRLERIELRSSTFLEIESKELKQLHLCQCKTPLQVSSLFKNDLCYKDSLIELRLDENRWSEIPDGIFQFQNLLELSLIRNRITHLPDKFTNLPNLQVLLLDHYRLTHLPPSIFALRNLSELQLELNEITELPDMFANLSKLQVLSLSYNELTSVPPSMFALQNLTELNLNYNYITALPDIFNLPKLYTLELGDNRLTHLPPSMFALQNLCELNLKGNLLTELPDIVNLPKLNTLRLDYNQFSHVSACIFEMQNLNLLSIDNNHITELPDKFTNLPNLEYLSLDNNPLQYLPPSILLHNIIELDITDNAFNFEISPSVDIELIVHSLKELSYRAILNHKLIVKEGMLPKRLLKDLDNYQQCFCGCKFLKGKQLSFVCHLIDISNTNLYNPRLRVPIRGRCSSEFL